MQVNNNSYISVGKSQPDATREKSKFTEQEVSIFGDKNNDGIIGAEDFSGEDLTKVEKNDLLRIFSGQKWTKQISDIFSSILRRDNNDSNDKNIETSIANSTKDIVYDKSSRTLKVAQKTATGDEYCDFQSYQFDENGQMTDFKDYNPAYYMKDGKKVIVGDSGANWIAQKEGFNPAKKSSPELNDFYEEYFNTNGKNIWTRDSNLYDEQGNLISKSQIQLLLNNNDRVIGRTEVQTSGSQVIKTTFDADNKFISKVITVLNDLQNNEDGSQELTTETENYDEQNNFLYKTKTTTVTNYIEEENEDGCIEERVEEKTSLLRTYPNGNIYTEEYTDEFNKNIMLKDKNGNILEQYKLEIKNNVLDNNGIRDENKQRYTKIYPDGHTEETIVDRNSLH